MSRKYGFPSGGHSDLLPKDKFSITSWLVVIGIVLTLLAFLTPWLIGAGGFGPDHTLTVTVTRTYVDSGEDSHYMVVTDHGVFEVDNGIMLWMWNSDELYGKIESGHTYQIKTKGNRVVNFLFQEYPYIVDVQEVKAK